MSSADISSLAIGENCFIGAEELENFYILLESSIPDLQNWQSPGRIEEKSKIENAITERERTTGDTQEAAKNDFDFSDFDGPTTSWTSLQNTPKSAKKKTANFADVLKKKKELQHNFK